MGKYIQILRIDHWFKNIFVFPGLILYLFLTAHEYRLFDDALIICFGLFAICLVCSANYSINECLDANTDKHHPIKKHRSAVVNNLNKVIVGIIYVLLIGSSIAISMNISMPFLVCILLFILMGIIYNVPPIRTKEIPFLDVLSESINNPIRLLLGWYMLQESGMLIFPPSSIIISYWFGGAYLMSLKRFSEYKNIADQSIAKLYRHSFAFYSEVRLLSFSIFNAMVSNIFLGIFLIRYRTSFILAFPLIALLFTWYFYISFEKDSVVQSPEKLFKKFFFVSYVLFLSAFLVFLLFVDIPVLNNL